MRRPHSLGCSNERFENLAHSNKLATFRLNALSHIAMFWRFRIFHLKHFLTQVRHSESCYHFRISNVILTHYVIYSL